ncbi:hypothetical protein PWG71_17645 [Nocardiopsis sp. N85]|uniref:hypothetical protein n=1 Tax=Nocardiopsis sp. N85 TaxID=3029400 RepID=UPI00237F3B4F|nr:hypothetical protein [Nocardiopsis sp. N85]MDE3723219.1 hypothetical protein [Nocardiopsis sp. N85]
MKETAWQTDSRTMAPRDSTACGDVVAFAGALHVPVYPIILYEDWPGDVFRIALFGAGDNVAKR